MSVCDCCFCNKLAFHTETWIGIDLGSAGNAVPRVLPKKFLRARYRLNATLRVMLIVSLISLLLLRLCDLCRAINSGCLIRTHGQAMGQATPYGREQLR
jgi:hypothetical protein